MRIAAVAATLMALAPGAYVGAVAADGAVGGHAVASKHKKPKHCRKGFVLRHNKCVAKSRGPVY
jgi:hypothetical protein